VNQELAKEGVPLPFGNRFWASNWPTRNAPLPGLIVHLVPSVSRLVSWKLPNLPYEGRRHYRTSTTSRISFYLGRRGVPITDHQPVRHSST
jgi:hypothetical protein